MAKNTPPSFQNLVIYEIFVRNHEPEGTFAGVTADLSRIKALGVDVLWLMPIHPIGQVRRKGKEGSPYAIADYRAVNPKYGAEAEFKQLIDTAHQLDLKVMMDVVFNHTAPDSVLARQHPEWLFRDESGQPQTRVPDWSDVICLAYDQPELDRYRLDVLEQWVKLGVDGFRCDVASLVPLEFWQQARTAIAKLKPDFIWLAESIHPHFIRRLRRQGYLALADAELYQAFDITYDYDLHLTWLACLKGEISLEEYVKMLAWQEVIYPANAIKLRFVENHDQLRAAAQMPDLNQLKNWTAFMAFNRGAFLIYAGQELATTHTPSLFERDPLAWPAGEPLLTDFLTNLARLKKDPATTGQFEVWAGQGHLQARWAQQNRGLYGLFNVQGEIGSVPVALPNGVHTNLLDQGEIQVAGDEVDLPLEPVIVRYEK